PAADGAVTVDVAAAAATDSAGNDSTAATQFSITNDGSAPSVSIASSSADVTGPFRVQFQFSEDVTDLLAETVLISNGALSDFSGSGAAYSGLVTPTTLGSVDILLPAGAAQDVAGNNSTEASLSVTASSGAGAVSVVVASGDNPADVNGAITLANPGSTALNFIAYADQPWLDVAPASGEIPSLGNLEVSFKINDLILDFPAGTYIANVIVEVDDGIGQASAATKASGNRPLEATGRRLIAEIPVTVELQEQRGDFELIVRTPSGLSNGSSFLLTSDIAAIDGQAVATNAGESRFAVSNLLNGSYLIEQPTLDGYLIADITCAGDTDNGNAIDIQSGRISIDLDATERQTCIITNSRNDAAIRLATMKAIRGFMERRGDRILSAAPDLSKRFAAREQVGAGAFNADANDLRASMSFEGSLSGARNQAKAKAVGDNADLVKPRFDGWDVWTSAEYAKVKDRRDGVGVDSEFFVAQLGADYQVRDNLLVGGLVQYDWMSEDDAVITPDVGALRGARVDGDGFMVGPYAVWKPAENLTVDAMGIFGQSSNNIDPFGYYKDQFETERFLLQTNVTGEFDWGGLRVRPQLGWAHYEDQQEDYIDSLGIQIPSQTVTIGRLRAGPEFVWSHRNDDVLLELGSSLRAVWNYEGAGTLDLNTGSLSTGGDPIRVDGGLSASLAFKSGFRVSVETSLDGIGQGDFNARSGRISFNFPFGGAGRAGTSQKPIFFPSNQSAAINGCGGTSSLDGQSAFCAMQRF
ncbi:autotransporter domain-containing protein, partial [Algimonas arctica]|uniref:autotransporter domain-containing protein n=1 Tax=Algimonas arctica TaxID=1479486 RepID=UPI00167A33A8